MSTFLFTLVITVLPTDAPASAADSVATRPYHEISRDMRELMKRESLADSDADRYEAVRRLAELYLEVKRDPRLSNAPTLQQYKAKLWSRLLRIKKDVERQLARDKAKKNHSQPESDEALLRNQEVQRTSESLAAQMSLVSNSMGGPGKLFSMAGGGAFGGGAVRDGGAELVELITHVIEPDFWDVNGGPGTIFYYQPLMALVVRATSEVHHKIGGGLGGLRK